MHDDNGKSGRCDRKCPYTLRTAPDCTVRIMLAVHQPLHDWRARLIACERPWQGWIAIAIDVRCGHQYTHRHSLPRVEYTPHLAGAISKETNSDCQRERERTIQTCMANCAWPIYKWRLINEVSLNCIISFMDMTAMQKDSAHRISSTNWRVKKIRQMDPKQMEHIRLDVCYHY